MNPEREMCECIQPVCFLIIVQETAAVPPAATFVLCDLGRLPLPGPIERHRGCAFGGVVTNKLDVRVVLQVGVRMELPCDEIIQLFGV